MAARAEHKRKAAGDGASQHAAPPPTTGRFVYKDDDDLEKPFDWQQLRRLLSYVKPYRKQVLLAFALMLVWAGARLASPSVLKWAIDGAIAEGDQRLLLWLTLLSLGLYLLMWLASSLRMRLSNWVGQRALADMRHELFSHIQGLSFTFYDGRPAGSILVRLTNDVNSLDELLSRGLIVVLTDFLTIIGIVAILLSYNWQLALLSFATLPLLFITTTRLRLRIRRSWQEVRKRQAAINAHLNEAIQGMRVTQAFVQEEENAQFFKAMTDVNKKSWMHAIRLNAQFFPVVEIISALGIGLVYWFGVRLLRADLVSIGTLVAFVTYIGQFWEPISRLGQIYSQLLQAMASSERIFEFMDTQPNVADKPGAIELPQISGRVSFEDVWFHYEEDRPVLHGINFTIEPGETVALVGPTGAGKSSIINLLCRFYDPVSGAVKIDGHDLRDVKLESLRSQIGIVLQDTFIFAGKVKDNIRYGRLNASDADVIEAARSVHAHRFIEGMPEGFDTEVKERGSRLSVGQRQLLSFARALLADPRILILDEATSSIDTQTEVLIQQALAKLLKGRTSFVIAHRLSTIRSADRIIVIDNGRIAEMGTHESLMAKGGIYRGLIEAQFRFFADAGD